MDENRFRARFLRRLANPFQLADLFDCLSEVYFYAKNEHGQFVKVNHALAAMHGLKSGEEMVGKTDLDFHPADLAQQYIEEDRRVREAGVPIVNQPWLVPDCRGVLRWFLSSKIPLVGKDGAVIGIAGAMHDFERTGAILRPYHEMQAVIAHIFTHYAEKMSLAELAELRGLSVSQLVRNFRRILQSTPNQFLLRVRIHAACQFLTSTDASIAKIALDTGFYDQSYFTKQFRRRMGISPHAYRQRYRHATDVEF